MGGVVGDVTAEFRKHKSLADRALAVMGDDVFFHRPGNAVNPPALIVKHLAGNLASRWTDFLTADGEKPTRDRDGEFTLTERDTRPALMAAWERGWQTLFDALGRLSDSDLPATVTIRGESHTVSLALARALAHAAYHVGQITYLSRMSRPDSPWLTIEPGRSREYEPAKK